jgi:8-oxo-dGTP diphosphatase
MGNAMKASKRYCYEYPRPALTVDLALVSRGRSPRVLLIRRRHEPFAGRWALPGGFVDEGEDLLPAAQRELREETGVVDVKPEQLFAVGTPGRDPRGWVVSVIFLARVNPNELQPKAADDAAEVGWFPLKELPQMAFDHAAVLARVLAHLGRRKRPR